MMVNRQGEGKPMRQAWHGNVYSRFSFLTSTLTVDFSKTVKYKKMKKKTKLYVVNVSIQVNL